MVNFTFRQDWKKGTYTKVGLMLHVRNSRFFLHNDINRRARRKIGIILELSRCTSDRLD